MGDRADESAQHRSAPCTQCEAGTDRPWIIIPTPAGRITHTGYEKSGEHRTTHTSDDRADYSSATSIALAGPKGVDGSEGHTPLTKPAFKSKRVGHCTQELPIHVPTDRGDANG